MAARNRLKENKKKLDFSTRIMVELEGGVGVGVSYATLDDNSWLEPAVEFYTSKAQPWVNLCSNTEKLTDMT